jgi:hypothetical protein
MVLFVQFSKFSKHCPRYARGPKNPSGTEWIPNTTLIARKKELRNGKNHSLILHYIETLLENLQVKILFKIIPENFDFPLENALNLVISIILICFFFEKDQKRDFLKV